MPEPVLAVSMLHDSGKERCKPYLCAGFVFPFMLHAMLNNLGLRWTLRIWAIMTCTATGIAFVGIRPRVPVTKPHPGQRRPRLIVPQMGYFKSPLFLSFVSNHAALCPDANSSPRVACHMQSFTCLIQGLSYFPVSLYIASFTQQVSTPLTATVALSLFNLAGVIGQVILGYLTDRFAYPWVMFFSSLGSALAAFLLWGFGQGPALIYPFAIIFGALVRLLSTSPPACRRISNLAHLDTYYRVAASRLCGLTQPSTVQAASQRTQTSPTQALLRSRAYLR